MAEKNEVFSNFAVVGAIIILVLGVIASILVG